MTGEKITKTEWVLLGMAAVFLCGLLGLHAWDRSVMAEASVTTSFQVAQEEFMPDLTPLDLNAATVEELTELPGIGEKLARRIVEYRTEHGPFQAVEELMEVSGIGEAKLAGLDGRVTVDEEETA